MKFLMCLIWFSLAKEVQGEYCNYLTTSGTDGLQYCEHGCCGTENARTCCTRYDYTWVVAVSVTGGVLVLLSGGFAIYFLCNRKPRLHVATYVNKPPNVGKNFKLVKVPLKNPVYGY